MNFGAAGEVVVWAIFLTRLVAPLFIPRFPLPAILVCFFADALDQTVLQIFTSFDLSGYQAYDKALDVYYLAIAMLAALRNWESRPAVRIARFLFYFRLVGVLAFELMRWRPLLLIFPNVFEFFFIFYEIVRSHWSPAHLRTRTWVAVAAGIWVGIKIPHEYWLHIARLDMTDLIKERLLGAPTNDLWGEAMAHVVLVAVVLLAATIIFLVLRRSGSSHWHPLTLAAAPIAMEAAKARELDRQIGTPLLQFDRRLLEKLALVGCLSAIFTQVLPGIRLRPAAILLAVAVFASIDYLVHLRRARSGRALESAILVFTLPALANLFPGIAAGPAIGESQPLPLLHSLICLLLLALIVALFDRWRPIYAMRFRPGEAPDDGG